MRKNCWTIRTLSILTCVHIVLLIGVVCLGIWGIPAVIKLQIHQQTQLENGTDQWRRFESLPFPLEFRVRFFNVTNGEVLRTNNDSIPKLTETRPYIYKLEINKVDITFGDKDDTVTYNRSMTLTYDDTQPYDDTDQVTIVNPVLLTALQITSTLDKIALAGCFGKIFNGMEGLFITKTVGDLVVNGIEFGHEDEKIGVACGLIREKAYDLVKNIRPIEVLKNPTTGKRYMKFSMFNWKTKYYSKEQKPDGEYTVLRGRNDMTQLGHIIRWNNSNEIGIWGNPMSLNNDTCRKVRGTDSTIFSPLLKEGENLDNFNTDVCRIVTINYKKRSSFSGIEGYRYETPNTTFWSATQNPENDCFCSKSTKNQFGEDDCYLDGVFDFKPCLGAPILVSFPHFMDAHEKYKQGVEIDSNYSSDDLQSYLLVEPNTGIPLQGRIRVQMNAVLRPEFLLDDLTPQNMTRRIVPILWLEESFDLPPKYVQMLHDQYFSKLALATGLKYGAIAVISVLLAVSSFFLIRKKYITPKKNAHTN